MTEENKSEISPLDGNKKSQKNNKIKSDEKIKKNLTVLGQETEFTGELEFTDNLLVTGKFNGKINASGALEIDKTAICNVEYIKAGSVIVSGKVSGNINAEDGIEMCSGSSVHGDVVASRIRISENVDFEGSVTMLEKESSSDLFSVSSEEFKNSFLLFSVVPH